MDALGSFGLERVRGVAKEASKCSEGEVRLPERLRQEGSKLVGRWLVRSQVNAPQPPAALPSKDFQMKATLDQQSYERMVALAVEYNLCSRTRGMRTPRVQEACVPCGDRCNPRRSIECVTYIVTPVSHPCLALYDFPCKQFLGILERDFSLRPPGRLSVPSRRLPANAQRLMVACRACALRPPRMVARV